MPDRPSMPPKLAALLGLALAGTSCGYATALYGGPPIEDVDGDGHFAGMDCDDRDPKRHPGADDPAGDGIDQNCDGQDGVAPAAKKADTGRPAPKAPPPTPPTPPTPDP